MCTCYLVGTLTLTSVTFRQIGRPENRAGADNHQEDAENAKDRLWRTGDE